MRIGIDCRTIYDVEKNSGAGIERYVFNLVKNLLRNDRKNDYILFFNDQVSEQTINSLKSIKDFKVIKVKNKIPFFSAHMFFTFKLWAEWLEWCFFPANVMPFLYLGKSILVIHDVAIYNHPEWFPNKQWFSKLLVVPSSVAKATKIVTISQTTKDDLQKLWKFKKAKDIKVIYQGVNKPTNYGQLAQGEVLKKFDINNKYLFFVGTIEPRKNLIRVFKAWKKYLMKTQRQDIKLIIAGSQGWKYKRIFFTLRKINRQIGFKAIKYIGKISDKEKNILMHNCQAFIFPSLYEGLGVPVLEAMNNNAAVITSKTSALGEIINDQAIKVNPENKDEIYQAIKKILAAPELSKLLKKKGLELSQQFNWDKTAKEFLEFI